MTREERLGLLDRFEGAYSLVSAQVERLAPEALDFIPPIPEAWSINDHLVHLLDAEVAVYFRIRLAQAEPGSRIQAWDELAWQAKLGYARQDGRKCLAQASALRSTSAAGLRFRVDEDWAAFWLEHPEKGRIDLVRILEIYRDHLAFHAPFIKRNLDAWKAR